MVAHIDTQRARHLMRASDLDALLFCSPANFFYSTGFSSGLAKRRQAPLATALLPAEDSIEPAVLVPATELAAVQRTSGIQGVYSFPIWWGVYDLDRVAGREGGNLEALLAQDPPQLPEQYDREAVGRLLSDILRERGLSEGKVGLELDFVDANSYVVLKRTNPKVEFFDSTSLMYELRSVKSPAEIDTLRKACLLTEAGIVAATEDLSERSTVGSITDTFHRGVWRAAREHGLTQAVGNIAGQPALEAQGGLDNSSTLLPQSTTVKFDMQVCLSHYHSDVGRTYVFGPPSPDQRRIHAVLLETHRRMRDALRPGVRFCDVY
jgi:Xaa-Pro aminopeptidase